MAKLTIEPITEPDKIFNYWKKEKLIVAYFVLCGLIYNIAVILGPIYQGKLIDSIVRGDSLSSVIRLGLTFIALIGMIQLVRYFKRFYIRRFANRTSATMRFMIYNSIMYKTLRELDDEDAGNLMTRIISDVDLCVGGMRKFTTEIFDTGVLMVSYFTAMLFYDVRITVMASIFIPLAMVLAEKLKSIIYKFSFAYRSQSSYIAAATYDAVENAMLYRANGMEKQNQARYNADLEDLQDKAIKANVLENSMEPIYNVIAMLGIILVIYLGGSKVIDGGWTIGKFSAYLIMFTDLAGKASRAARLFNTVQKSQVSWQRIKPYFRDYQSKDTASDISAERTVLSVKNLNFSYPNTRENIIENISFTGQQGELIGITGSIASGKSTLGLALLGFYPYLGSIKIDGRELVDYTEYERSQLIAYMGHNPQLLSDTIHNNVALGNKQNVISLLTDVSFMDDLASMPEGEDTLVGNGGIRLSGGQQARIALARTLLQHNKIIILDDPFSAVDMKTEEKIIANLKKNYRECLIILISHRLMAFRQADSIILLHSDKKAEYGTHDELMSNSEIYAEIFKLQCTAGDTDAEQ